MTITISGYILDEKIFESSATVIFRGEQEHDRRPVVAKTLNSEYPSNEAVAHLRREYQILSSLQGIEGVITIYGLEKFGQSNLAMIMEPFGESLAEVLQQNHRFSLERFFPFARQLTTALGAIHQANVIHKDLNPHNVLIEKKGAEQIRIIDFGIASKLPRERQGLNPSLRLEGSLAYLSPEQTGRMSRDVDYRSDYYSLGVTFYELLTGSRPFEADDLPGWVHGHLSQTPQPPHERTPQIPEALSAVILKLLSKNAEDRYQSAHGLLKDLQRCQEEWEQSGSIQAFALGQQDISEKFQLPQRLWGREAEIERLLRIFSEVAHGRTELVMVEGEGGVGKTALVHEIQKPIVQERAYFIEGKFEQLGQHVPYYALKQALTQLVHQLLSESNERLETWRAQILDTVGPNASILLDLVPDLKKILGSQSAVPDLPPTQAQHRFRLVFQDFIQIFAKEAHPLVLFIDNLQWCDEASFTVLEHLLTVPKLGALMVIGTYRHNEIPEDHPLPTLLGNIAKTTPTSHITLAPLESHSVTDFVVDALRVSRERAYPLAELLHKKTQGNPLFVGEILKTLYYQEAITFDAAVGQWTWEMVQIEHTPISDNVVELLIARFQTLSSVCQQILQRAACIGATFDFYTVSMIAEQPLDVCEATLQEALHQGLILPEKDVYADNPTAIGNRPTHNPQSLELSDDHGEYSSPFFGHSFHFQHDRVQQAVYTSIDATRRELVHLSIARLIRQHSHEDELKERVEELVRHGNEGRRYLDDCAEREELAQWNLDVGLKYKRSFSYLPALQCFQIAAELLPDDHWHTHHELSFTLAREQAQSLHLNGETDLANHEFECLANRPLTESEQVEVLFLWATMSFGNRQFEECFQICSRALEVLELPLPPHVDSAEIHHHINLVKKRMERCDIDDLMKKPPLRDPDMEIASKFFHLLNHTCFITGKEHFSHLCALCNVDLSLRHGFGPEAPNVFCQYSSLLRKYGEANLSRQIGELALSLHEQYSQQASTAIFFINYTGLVLPWIQHWKFLNNWYQKGIDYSYQIGDFNALVFVILNHSVWDPTLDIATILQQRKKGGEILRKVGMLNDWFNQAIWIRLYVNLRGLTNDRFSLSDESFDESATIRRAQENNAVHTIEIYHLVKATLHFHYGDDEEAVRQSERLPEIGCSFEPMACYWSWYTLIDFLSHAAIYPTKPASQQQTMWRKLRKQHQLMKEWAEQGPMNFLHQQYLMEAELARLSGQCLEAETQYELAIQTAKENEFRQHEALANELAAKHYLNRGLKRAAEGYMRQAHYLYYRWGATRKLEHLEETYSDLLGTTMPLPERNATGPGLGTGSRTPSTSTSREAGTLDFTSLLKSCQALSREMHMPNMLSQLMGIMLENAGAQRGVLLLERDGEWLVEAEGRASPDAHILFPHIPLERYAPLSVAVVRYVARTHEQILLHDAAREGSYTQDPYMVTKKPQSLLCLPITHQAKLTGILYLENNLATGVFTPDRVDILQALASQAAISIENARLYTDLQHSEQKFRRLADSNIIGVCFGNRDQIYEANEAFLKMLGYSRADLPLDWRAMTPPAFVSRDLETRDLFLTTGTVNPYEKAFFHKDGHIVPVVIGAASIQGSASDVVCFVLDLSEQKRAEAALHQLNQELEDRVHARTEELQEAVQELESFSYSVSHDLRAPLRGIHGYGKILLQDFAPQLPPEGKRYLGLMRQEAETMGTLINDLLTLSRMGRQAMQVVELDMEALFQAVYKELMRIDPKRLVKLELSADLPQGVGDPVMVRQVILNLLSNALKFSRPRDPANIEITGSDEGSHSLYRVKDNGVGFDMGYAKKLFGEFQRLHGADEFEGTGVGLAIVHRIIRRHGGEVWGEGAVDQGATFTFTLPKDRPRS